MLKRLFTISSLLFLLLAASHISYAQSDEELEQQMPRDGVMYRNRIFLPELSAIGSNELSIGAGYGFHLVNTVQYYTYRQYALEVVPAVHYTVLPEQAVNLSVRAAYTIGLPILVGVRYNYAIPSNGPNTHQLEPLIGFSKFTHSGTRIAYWKVLAGYQLGLDNNSPGDDIPFNLHIIIGLNLKR